MENKKNEKIKNTFYSYKPNDTVKINLRRALLVSLKFPGVNENIDKYLPESIKDENKTYTVFLSVDSNPHRGKDTEECSNCPFKSEGCKFNLIVLDGCEGIVWCGALFDKVK